MKFFLPSLNGGEISDLLAGRGDFKQRSYGGSTVLNFIPIAQGPLIGRGGTKYIGSVSDSTKRNHLIGLDSASGSSYIVEMSQYRMRFYTSGALVTGATQAISSWGGNATITFTDSGDWVNWTGHGLPLNATVKFTSTLTLPTGITSGTTYYVYSVETNRFQISSYPNGTQLTFTGTGSGTITGYHNLVVTTAENSFNQNDLVTISGATGVPTLINGTYAVKNNVGGYSTVTISQANPGVVTWTGHGLSVDDPVVFRTTGSVPTGLTAGTTYYVKTVLTSDTFTVASSPGGAAIETTSAGSGTHGGMTTANTTRFELHTIDGDVDFVTGNVDVSTYTALAGSPVVGFIGKMHPWTEAMMFSSSRFDIGYSVLGDSIYFAYKNTWPIKLTVNSSTDWDFVPHAYDTYTASSGTLHHYMFDGPWQKPVKDTTVELYNNCPSASGSTGTIFSRKNTSGTANATVFTQNDVGMLIRQEPNSGSQVNPAAFLITAFTSSSQASVVRLDEGGTSGYRAGYRKGLWHSSIGYPHRVCFYQDRACYSMMTDYPTRVELSESGNYEGYSPTDVEDVNEVVDSNAISFELPGDGTGRIQWAAGAGDALIIGTEGNIFSASGTDSSILAPGKVQSNAVSSYGAENITPIQAGGSLYYVEKGGTKIRVAGNSQGDFKSTDITRVNPQVLNSGALGMVFSKTPYSIAWLWRNDGQIVGLTIDEEENVYAFSRHVIGGSYSSGDAVVESMAVINSSSYHKEVWMVVKRTINSSTVRYVERLSPTIFDDYSLDQREAICVDSAYTNFALSATNVPSGALNHLIGETVDVIADGKISSNTVNGSGQLTTALSSTATRIIVGLSYRPKFETTDLQVMSDTGHTFGIEKRIHECDVGFYRTLGAKIGGDSSTLNTISFGEYATSMGTLFTGVKKQPVTGSHTETPRVRIEQHIPAPICITFINAEGEAYG